MHAANTHVAEVHAVSLTLTNTKMGKACSRKCLDGYTVVPGALKPASSCFSRKLVDIKIRLTSWAGMCFPMMENVETNVRGSRPTCAPKAHGEASSDARVPLGGIPRMVVVSVKTPVAHSYQRRTGISPEQFELCTSSVQTRRTVILRRNPGR